MADIEGKSLRSQVPRRAHGDWEPADDRVDPIELLRARDASRVPDLVPIRYERMLASPFAYYRGAAAVMAADLDRTPTTGLDVQCSGDAHPANFGLFATPERRLVFSVNDFDETLPGPWEWDCKRLVAGMAVAAGEARFDEKRVRAIAVAIGEEYRRRIAEYSAMPTLDVWYSTVDAGACEQLMRHSAEDPRRALARARRHHHLHSVGRLTEVVHGRVEFREAPPLLSRRDGEADERQRVMALVEDYRSSLRDERQRLLHRYEVADVARKVVGVGSVGTHCWIVLLVRKDDAIILQLKEAHASVLEHYLPGSDYAHHGRRVVVGQRSMQAFPDIFLGWGTAPSGRSFYVRQLQDMKGSFDIMHLDEPGLEAYGRLCAWSLAWAHARTGDARALADYLGSSDVFDQALAEFGLRYAEQNSRDYAALQQAASDGRLPLEK